jgi:hypothetical protein
MNQTGQYIVVTLLNNPNPDFYYSSNYGGSFTLINITGNTLTNGIAMDYSGLNSIANHYNAPGYLNILYNSYPVTGVTSNYVSTYITVNSFNTIASNTVFVGISGNGRFMYVIYPIGTYLYGIYLDTNLPVIPSSWTPLPFSNILNPINLNSPTGTGTGDGLGITANETGQYVYISAAELYNVSYGIPQIWHSNDYGATFNKATINGFPTNNANNPTGNTNSIICDSSGKYVFFSINYAGNSLFYSYDYGNTFYSYGLGSKIYLKITKVPFYGVTSDNNTSRYGFNF